MKDGKVTLDKSILTCINCGRPEYQPHAPSCYNANKSESDKVYKERQITYKPVLAYVVERILRDRLSPFTAKFVDSVVVEVNKAIETSKRNE